MELMEEMKLLLAKLVSRSSGNPAVSTVLVLHNFMTSVI